MIPDHIPNEVIVDTKIVVDQPVTHTGNIFPGYTGIKAQNIFRDVFDRFSDNFQATGSDPYRFALFRERLIDQLCAGTGGPYTYTGKNMYDAHDGMNITNAEFTSLVNALVAALNQFNVPSAEQNELLGILGPMQTDIVGH